MWFIRTELGGVVVTGPAVTDLPLPRPSPDIEQTWR